MILEDVFCALQLVSRLLFLLVTYLVSWLDLFVPNCMLTLDMSTWVSVWQVFLLCFYPIMAIFWAGKPALEHFRPQYLCRSESVTITPKDSRWVGAWWIGFLIASGLMFISAIPFWFLPRSPLKPEEDESRCGDKDGAVAAVRSDNNLKLADIAKSWGNPLLMSISAQIKTLSKIYQFKSTKVMIDVIACNFYFSFIWISAQSFSPH